MLDDPSRLVRLALAEALASSPRAPRPVILALAHDHSAIAAVVLRGSPLLSDADLVDRAALGDARVQTAIARRPTVSAAVAGALAEVGVCSAVAELLHNPGATVVEISLRRIADRLGHRAEVRQALLVRGWTVPETVRDGREAAEEAAELPDGVDPSEVERLVTTLKDKDRLTPAVLCRALLSHRPGVVEAALAELSGTTPARVAHILQEGAEAEAAALYDRAGLPLSLKPAFAAALSALRRQASPKPAARFNVRHLDDLFQRAA
jgi:uncharacterized protein (DUF2336 family)